MFENKRLSKQKPQCLSLAIASVALGIAVATPQIAEAAAIRSGFDSNTLPANDDGSTGLVPIGFDINLGGSTTNQLYVNNNGNVTFDGVLSTYTPFNIETTDSDIIAPFFADVDTAGANSSPVTYGTGTVDGRNAFGVNWVNVGFYDDNDLPLNSFQLVLTDRSDVEAGAFDIEFNYNQILWETGDASDGINGLGGDSARAGYAYGEGENRVSFELPGSAINGAFLDGGVNALVENSLNSEVDGRYLFAVRDGEIIDPTGTPEPVSILGLLTIGSLAVFNRKKAAS